MTEITEGWLRERGADERLCFRKDDLVVRVVAIHAFYDGIEIRNKGQRAIDAVLAVYAPDRRLVQSQLTRLLVALEIWQPATGEAEDEVCHCGMLMDDHHEGSSCSMAVSMGVPPLDQQPAPGERERRLEEALSGFLGVYDKWSKLMTIEEDWERGSSEMAAAEAAARAALEVE